MSNKSDGTKFERNVCKLFSSTGHWVHFMSPDTRGAQPFDIIAVKDGVAKAVECKVLSGTYIFRKSRLEENQINAFLLWEKCGNSEPIIAILNYGDTYLVPYHMLDEGKIDLREHDELCIMRK